MSLNFHPNRERMFKEIAQCAALNRLENLMSFCNSCSFKTLKGRPAPECRECIIELGIKAISKKKRNWAWVAAKMESAPRCAGPAAELIRSGEQRALCRRKR